jgi:hypothetical protein
MIVYVSTLLRPGTGALQRWMLFSSLVLLAARLGMAQDAVPAPLPPLMVDMPKDYQVVQRHSRDQGGVVVAGSIHLPDNAAPDGLERRLSGPPRGGPLPEDWSALKFEAKTGLFNDELTVRTGGWYRLEIRVSYRGQWVATNVVEHVGVGEVFVVAGQSNSANYGEKKNQTVTGLVSAFDGKGWRLAADPEPGAGGKKGSFMPIFGDAMMEEFHVPVGLVPMGIGSTSVREWLPAGIVFTNPPMILRNVITNAPGQWESTGKIFTNFCARMKLLGPQGFRAVLWHQGESDAKQAKPECTLPGSLYHDYLKTVIVDSRREIGWAAPWFVAQVSYHNPGDVGSPDIRAAQEALWDEGVALEGPDTDTLTGAMREKNGRGIHLSAAGLQAHGQMWAAKVGPWLEKQIEK